jgi:hypothetical protein
VLVVALVTGSGPASASGLGLPPIIASALGGLGVDLDDLLEDAIAALPLPDLSQVPGLPGGAAPVLPLPGAGSLPAIPDLGPLLPLPLLPDLDGLAPPPLPLPDPVTLPDLPSVPMVPAVPSIGDLPLPVPAQLEALFVDLTVQETLPGGGTATTTARLAPYSPATVDTDGQPGDGAEILALATIGTDGLTLRVEQLPGAAQPYRAKVVGTITDPTSSSGRYSLGFDGRAQGAPDAVDLGVALAGGGGSVTVRTVGAGPSLDLLASVAQGGTEALSAMAGLAPVPASTVISIAGDRVGFEVSEPTVLDLQLREGARTTSARVDRIPRSLTLVRSTSVAGEEVLALTASGRIASMAMDVVEPGSVAHLALADVPPSVTLSRSPARVRVEAPGRIGVVELTLHRGDAAPTLPDPAYVHVTDEGVAARLTGLTEAEATVGGSGPLRALVAADPGPFRVLLETGDRSTDLAVRDLPGRLEVALDPAAGLLSYEASAPIERITAALADPGGLGGGLTTLDLLLLDLPASLSLGVAAGGTGVDLDAHGQRIGLIEASGNGATVPAAGDGLFIDDDGLALRLTGLRRLQASVADPARLVLHKDAGPFRASIHDGARQLELDVLDAPEVLDVTVDPTGLTMSNSAPIARITARASDPAGLLGRATDLQVTLLEVPAALTLGLDASGGLVQLDTGGAAIGLLDLVATSTPATPQAVPAGADGVVFEDTPDRFGVAARLTGLRAASVGTRASDQATVLALDKAPGAFTFRVVQGARTVEGTFADLPDGFTAALSPTGDLAYQGTAGIDRIDLAMSDPSGISGRATRLVATLLGLPASLELATDAGGGTLALDAHGARIGLLELALADAATAFPTVAGGGDGVTIVDQATAYGLAARLTGLRAASVALSGTPITVALTKDPGPFRVRLDQASRQASLDVLDLPATLSASINPAGSLAYAASAPIARLDLDLTDPAGVAGRAVRADLTLTGLPTSLTLGFAASGDVITIDAGAGSIGLLDLLLTSGPVATVPAGSDGVTVTDSTASYVVAARLSGLRRLTGNLSTVPVRLAITKAPGPFGLDHSTGGRVLHASVEDLPSSIDLSFDPAGALGYTASSPIGRIAASLSDTAGIGGRYKTADLVLTGLPSSLDIGFAGAGGSFQADARGATIGSIEALLTSGPVEAIPAGRDGVIQRDLTDRAVTVVRLTGLRQASLTVGPPTDAFVTSTGGRPFTATLQSLEGTKVETVAFDLAALATTVRAIVPAGTSNITYSASSTTPSLSFSTNAGSRESMAASLAPVPTALAVCTAADNRCFRFPNEAANAGSVLVTASSHTTVNLFDCLVGPCTNPAKSLRATNLFVRKLGFQANTSNTGANGYVSLDTDNTALRGFVELRTGNGTFDPRINARFGNTTQTSSLVSENRIGRWSFFGVSQSASGSITCGGSSLSVQLFGLTFDVTDFLC